MIGVLAILSAELGAVISLLGWIGYSLAKIDYNLREIKFRQERPPLDRRRS